MAAGYPHGGPAHAPRYGPGIQRLSAAAAWSGLATAVAVAGLALDALVLPSASLFAALLVGVAAALSAPGRFALPAPVNTGARAVAGVTLGVFVKSSSLGSLADSWLPVALISLATLASAGLESFQLKKIFGDRLR